MAKSKWQINHSIKTKFWPGYLHIPNNSDIAKNIKKVTDETSKHIASAHISIEAYALDFHSKTFWDIRVKEVNARTNIKDIQLFFEEFENINVVLITMKDTDFPAIDEKSFIVLEFPKHTRKIHARFFWAILPKKIKDPYMTKYTDHYERLTDLLSDFHKLIDIDDYEL